LRNKVRLGLQKQNSQVVDAKVYIQCPSQVPTQGTDMTATRTLSSTSATVQIQGPTHSRAGHISSRITISQQVVGSLLLYCRDVDPTILDDISALASQQSTAIEDTNTKLLRHLNLCASRPHSKIRYTARDMILNIHWDAGCLNDSEARSRAGEFFFMSSQPKNGEQQHNGALLNLCTIFAWWWLVRLKQKWELF
jgi:hypothetical protein